MTEPLADLAGSWRIRLRADGRAARTVKLYTESLDQFVAWLGEQGEPATLDQLTRDRLTAWLASLAESGRAPNTVAARFRALRRFCRWLVAEGDLSASPLDGVPEPKVQPGPVPILTDAEITALLKVTSGTTFEARRDHAVVRVLFDCGLRIRECANLTLDDVDLSDLEVVRVIGKGGKPRVVPFGRRTALALDRYLKLRRRQPNAHLDHLWLAQRGRLTVDGLDKALRRRADQAGVDGLHAHLFRHTAAHRWLAAGGAEQDLKRLMGWSSDAMLAVYGRSAADERAREAFRRMGLGDRL